MKKLFVLSDIHLGAGLPSDWFIPSKHQPPLEFMLQRIYQETQNGEPGEVELVIAGDLFDTWVCPLETEPPRVEQIIQHNDHIFQLLKQCASGLDHLYYIPGNHDFHVTKQDIQTLEGLDWIPVYNTGRIWIEHGNRYCIFNAPDQTNDPEHQFPLGYYISRLVAGHPKFDTMEKFNEVFSQLIENIVHKENLVNDIIDALMTYSDHKGTDKFRMPPGCPSVTIDDVRRIYKDLFQQWVKEYGIDYTLHAISGETLGLEFFYKKNCHKSKIRIQVMGHTHKAELEKTVPLSGKETLYGNSGSWISSKEPAACVTISESGKQYEGELCWVSDHDLTRERLAHL